MKYQQICIFLCASSLLLSLAVLPASGQATADPEIVFWESVRDSNDIEMYRAYLKHHPQGHFATLAKIKIKSLSQKTPSAPTVVTPPAPPSPGARIRLRSRPVKLHDRDLRELLRKHNFSVPKGNPGGAFENKYVDNRDGTITDETTGLVWQAGPSSSQFNRSSAIRYVEKLNRDQLGGRTNWRLPTVEELASLVELKPQAPQWLHINKMFHRLDRPTADKVWSADELISGNDCYSGGWVVNFWHGSIAEASWGGQDCRPYRYPVNEKNYIRAVCSK